MKRLLFLPHSSESSGAPRVTVDLARRLADRGWDVELLFPESGGLEVEARKAGLPVSVLGYPVGSFADSEVRSRISKLVLRSLALARLWGRVVRHRPALVWIGSSVAIPALIVCRCAGARVVVHVHEHPDVTRDHSWRIRVLRRLAHGLIFVGPLSREPFAPKPPRQLWATIANPMDVPPVRSDVERAALRASLGAAEFETVFVCAAFLHPRKDHETLIRAFAQAIKTAPEIRLWVAGDEASPFEGIRARLEAIASSLGVYGRVTFLGQRNDIAALFHAGDVCVLASQREAMPLAIAEAQLVGRPVVATGVGDVPLMVPDGVCGVLAESGNVEGLAGAMSRMANDPQARRQLGLASLRRAQKLYAARSIMPLFERVIRRVARP